MASSVFLFPSSVNGVVQPSGGGTGITSYAVGDLLYASATTTLSKLADVAVGQVLVSGGVATAPAWSPNLLLAQGTITADAQALATTATWNNAAITFTHLKATITNTASNSASMALQIFGGAAGTTSMLSVRAVDGKVIGNSTFEAGNGSSFQWTGRSVMKSPADGQLNFTNNGESAGIGLDVATDGTLKVRVRAQNADAALTASTITASSNILIGAASVPTAVASGYKIARGATSLDGANPTPVATGLTSVVAFATSLRRTTAVSTGTAFLTNDAPSGANVDVYGWVIAGSASTGTETFDWVAVGT